MSPVSYHHVQQLHYDAPLVDVHAHPSLKSWLFDRPLNSRGHSTGYFNPFSDRTSLPKMRDGGVRVVFVSHHVPEEELFERSWLACLAIRALGMNARLREGSPYDRLETIMDHFEEQLPAEGDHVALARTPDELENHLNDHKLVLLHAVEGGHVLETDVDRLEPLANRGLVCLTLTHFFDNGIARNVDSIPDSMLAKSIGDFELSQDDGETLTEFGRAVLDRLEELGILIDLTHTAPDSRRAIYEHLPASLPLVATHVGLRTFCPDPMNLSDDELQEIAERNGAVGLIFFKYFLDRSKTGDILDALWESIEHIYRVTGSWDHIMIGTDFDGFTSPSPSLQDATDMPTFTKMLIRRGLPDEVIRKILGGNAMRVIKQVWQPY